MEKGWCRLELGEFIVGGEGFRDKKGNELFDYLNGGDFKGGLNVYFSG
ncbi:accessory Sec system protein Asp2, partial [Staphylococcus capitis]